MENCFRLSGVSDRFWNKDDFIEFLLQHQGQPIILKMAPEAVCLRNLGVYYLLETFGFKDVIIVTGNPLECHDYYKIHLLNNQWVKKHESVNVNLHDWNCSKIFYALFGRPTAARLGIAGYLKRYHDDQTNLHFSCSLDPDNLVQFELDKLLDYRIQSIKDIFTIIENLPLLLSSPDRYTTTQGYDYSDPLTKFYQDILIDIVVESHVSGNTFYPTEKTFRPMWLKKPFIIFASRDYLDYLHQMGFKTFCEFWDETYDGYETGERLSRILGLIDWLSKKSINDLVEMYNAMKPILDHNYNLLAYQTYKTEITKID